MARGLIGIIKLAIFVLFLPVLIAVIYGLNKELATISDGFQMFWQGAIAYTLFHLFIFTPQSLYRFWQSVFMEICSFAGIVANAIVLCVPIITTVLLLAYFLAVVIFNQTWAQHTLVFFTGFSMALHVILSAQELYEEDESKLKGHYLFNMQLVFIVNVFLLILLFDLIFKNFSFMGFWQHALKAGDHIYSKILHSAGIH